MYEERQFLIHLNEVLVGNACLAHELFNLQSLHCKLLQISTTLKNRLLISEEIAGYSRYLFIYLNKVLHGLSK